MTKLGYIANGGPFLGLKRATLPLLAAYWRVVLSIKFRPLLNVKAKGGIQPEKNSPQPCFSLFFHWGIVRLFYQPSNLYSVIGLFCDQFSISSLRWAAANAARGYGEGRGRVLPSSPEAGRQ